MSRIFWDTNLFIYLFEDYGPFTARVAQIRKKMRERGDELYTSTLTLGETLVKPLEKADTVLRRAYEDVLRSQASIIPFDQEAALIYAGIRKNRSIKPPDAIQLACAAKARVDLFLTNDSDLAEKTVTGIPFICALDRAPI